MTCRKEQKLCVLQSLLLLAAATATATRKVTCFAPPAVVSSGQRRQRSVAQTQGSSIGRNALVAATEEEEELKQVQQKETTTRRMPLVEPISLLEPHPFGLTFTPTRTRQQVTEEEEDNNRQVVGRRQDEEKDDEQEKKSKCPIRSLLAVSPIMVQGFDQMIAKKSAAQALPVPQERLLQEEETQDLTPPPTANSSSSRLVQAISHQLDDWYLTASKLKCPFWRRRLSDVIDGLSLTICFLLIRHKTLHKTSDVVGSLEELRVPPGCKAVGRHVRYRENGVVHKRTHLSVQDVAEAIRRDWSRSYYITGRLDSTIYRDDCLFTGPDPDMPVRGLRKYLSAASHLFDPVSSRATLTHVAIEPQDGGGRDYATSVIVAQWRIEGALLLPWRPRVKPWTGTTRYYMDNQGLIQRHVEEWDISVWEAFLCTISPRLGKWMYGEWT